MGSQMHQLLQNGKAALGHEQTGCTCVSQCLLFDSLKISQVQICKHQSEYRYKYLEVESSGGAFVLAYSPGRYRNFTDSSENLFTLQL